MAQLTDRGFVRDRNFDDCLRWLYDKLRLTPEEQTKLINICSPDIKGLFNTKESEEEIKPIKPRLNRLTDQEKEFILNNCHDMTAGEISRELGRDRNLISAFLVRKGINYKKYVNPNAITEEQGKFIMTHCKVMTIREMSSAMNAEYRAVMNFVKRKGLIFKREKK